jgi:hypothetical protein
MMRWCVCSTRHEWFSMMGFVWLLFGITNLSVDGAMLCVLCSGKCQVWDRTDAKREKKVVVLMELHRAIIYTTKMSKQVTKSHVRDAVHMYFVN